jgi:hypothetical protein
LTALDGRAIAKNRQAKLGQKHQPRRSVEDKVKPVDGPHQPSLNKHLNFLDDVRWSEGGKPEGQTGNDDDTPRQRGDGLAYGHGKDLWSQGVKHNGWPE